jgi:hypothetical protein
MADLLECVIQIKALAATLETATLSIASGSSPDTESVTVSELWRQMADVERRYAQALGTAAGSRRGITSAPEGAADARGTFLQQRRANLAMLDSCTAAQLGGCVEWAGRPSTTVADLVAIMLAHDTDVLGGLRRARHGRRSYCTGAHSS